MAVHPQDSVDEQWLKNRDGFPLLILHIFAFLKEGAFFSHLQVMFALLLHVWKHRKKNMTEGCKSSVHHCVQVFWTAEKIVSFGDGSSLVLPLFSTKHWKLHQRKAKNLTFSADFDLLKKEGDRLLSKPPSVQWWVIGCFDFSLRSPARFDEGCLPPLRTHGFLSYGLQHN